MAPAARPALLWAWLVSLALLGSPAVHLFTHSQLIAPRAAPGLPKRQSLLRVNELALSAYDSGSRRMAPRNGYRPAGPESQQFWSVSSARCTFWDPWVEGEYQALVRAVNGSSPSTEEYYLQVEQRCEAGAAGGPVRAVTRYALNGRDVLLYQGERGRWLPLHRAAAPVAERWNRDPETLAGISAHSPQQCRAFLRLAAAFAAAAAAPPTASVSLVPGARGRPPRLLCHVTGFAPRPIEVGWEGGGPGAQASSGVRPNGDPTFQVRLSLELPPGGPGPTEPVCLVRHAGLGGAPLRVRWEPPARGQAASLAAGCLLAGLGAALLGRYLWGRPGRLEGPTRAAQTQPGAGDPAPPEPGRR